MKVTKRLRISLVLPIVAIISLLLVCGCVPSASETTPPESDQPAPEQAAAEKIIWKGQQSHSPGEFLYDRFALMCEEITQASEGRLELKPFAGNAISPVAEQFDAVDVGLLDFAQDGVANWKNRYPASPLFAYMVGGLSGMEYLGWLYRGGAQYLTDMIQESNVYYIPCSGVIKPPEIFLHSKVPIESAADIKGMKIRAYGDGSDILGMMGGSMIYIPGAEIYEAAQRGVIDAFESSTAKTDWDLGFHEVAEYVYLSDSRQPMEYIPMIVNKDSWAKLPPDLQFMVTERMRTNILRIYFDLLARDVEALQQYRDYGCQVMFIPDDVNVALYEAADQFYAQRSAEDPFAAEVIASMQAYKAATRQAVPRL